MQPEVRYFIPCWKEPTIDPRGPSVHEILYALRPKAGHSYPIWQQPFFVFLLLANVHGVCRFQVTVHLEELESDALVQATDELVVDLGNDPLRAQPISIMMKATKLPRAGVYRLDMVSGDRVLASATFHAR